MVALNRAVAVARVRGPRAGLEAVESIRHRPMLESYHLLHAVLAEFESQLNNCDVAASHLRKALELTEQKAGRMFLTQRLEALEQRGRGVVHS